MTTVNTPAASSASADMTPVAKRIQAFYSQKDSKGPVVSLWLSEKTQAKSPDFDGTIDGQRVAGYLQKGPKAGFVSFLDSKTGKGADGNYTQVATANVVVNRFGIPNLVIKSAGKDDLWVECSLKLSQDTLIAAGLNLEILAAKKAEAATAKAAAAKAKEAVPA